MGRRSINTTKSGKYMNPTDQARKEARKKELKKNKKQRQMVRTAVLKGKDPNQLIAEMEKIDQMEFNVVQPPILNEKVLKDKRKKLKDTFIRVLKLYQKEDPEKWAELRRLEVEYEKRRSALILYFEAVRHAQQVQVEEIPLPSVSLPPSAAPSQIPLPNDAPSHVLAHPAHGILKKTSVFGVGGKLRKPPGVPPGPPPDLSDDDDEDDDDDGGVSQDIALGTSEDNLKSRQRTIRFVDDGEGDEMDVDDKSSRKKPQPTALQQKMLQLAGQDIEEFMKEMEEVHRRRELDHAKSDVDGSSLLDSSSSQAADSASSAAASSTSTTTNTTTPFLSVHGLGPPPLLFRPPPPPRMPPGPPPGLPPRMAIRLPPGPPPGLPPPRLLRPPAPLSRPPPPLPPLSLPPPPNPNVLSAGPQLIARPRETAIVSEPKKPTTATIQAKPQIRNLSADVTRFLPTALRIKREDTKRKKDTRILATAEAKKEMVQMKMPQVTQQSKDDAYQRFMKEMQGLL